MARKKFRVPAVLARAVTLLCPAFTSDAGADTPQAGHQQAYLPHRGRCARQRHRRRADHLRTTSRTSSISISPPASRSTRVEDDRDVPRGEDHGRVRHRRARQPLRRALVRAKSNPATTPMPPSGRQQRVQAPRRTMSRSSACPTHRAPPARTTPTPTSGATRAGSITK